MRRTIRTKHLPNVLHQSLWLLPGGKVPAFLMLLLEDDVTELPVPHSRRRSDLLGEVREALCSDNTLLVKVSLTALACIHSFCTSSSLTNLAFGMARPVSACHSPWNIS